MRCETRTRLTKMPGLATGAATALLGVSQRRLSGLRIVARFVQGGAVMEYVGDAWPESPPEPKLISVKCGWCEHWVEVPALDRLLDWELEMCPNCGEAL